MQIRRIAATRHTLNLLTAQLRIRHRSVQRSHREIFAIFIAAFLVLVQMDLQNILLVEALPANVTLEWQFAGMDREMLIVYRHFAEPLVANLTGKSHVVVDPHVIEQVEHVFVANGTFFGFPGNIQMLSSDVTSQCRSQRENLET